MLSDQIQEIFSSNRTEELGYDVWESFVISPTFPKLDVGHTKKPRVIVGGRGCGKTMLLRYLSHESAFSSNRENYPIDALKHIGLYWRADTQFASLLDKRGLQADTWRAAFGHLAALVLGVEALKSLESISSHPRALITIDAVQSLEFGRLQAFSSSLPSTYTSLLAYLEDRIAEFESWANDVRAIDQPQFLPGNKFVARLVQLIRDQIPALETAIFYVYIDEYENLNPYQQRMVNTWLKHSEPPLIFNLAMKRNGFKIRDTEGNEALSNIHDYREVYLESFEQTAFPVFAAEILLSRLQLAGVQIENFDKDLLRNPKALNDREREDYRRSIIESASSLFPSPSQNDLANSVFSDKVMRDRLKSNIKQALTSRGLNTVNAADLISSSQPSASIIMPALIHRQRLSISEIQSEFKSLLSNQENRFEGSTNWIHNNFIGCYLQLYDGLVRPCPLFSGFNTFCYMSRGNLRHFLELCHQAINRANSIDSITPEAQAEAARQVAADLLSEIRSFGIQGNNLHTFVLRLGSLFSLAQQRPTQSEPEQTHFSVKEGESSLNGLALEFLSEAVKWSVLFEEKGTKKKTESDPEGLEYVLNPIYAPYFHISYRKRRKLELPSVDVSILISGEYSGVRQMLKDYQSRWTVNLEHTVLPLFAHLDDTEER